MDPGRLSIPGVPAGMSLQLVMCVVAVQLCVCLCLCVVALVSLLSWHHGSFKQMWVHWVSALQASSSYSFMFFLRSLTLYLYSNTWLFFSGKRQPNSALTTRHLRTYHHMLCDFPRSDPLIVHRSCSFSSNILIVADECWDVTLSVFCRDKTFCVQIPSRFSQFLRALHLTRDLWIKMFNNLHFCSTS